MRGERVDAVLEGRELGMALAEELQALAPFGQGNPTVSLLLRGATLADRRPMGEGRHAALHGARPRRARAALHARWPAVAKGGPALATSRSRSTSGTA